MYNLRGATVSLRPKNLAPRRWWSRKYPICITLAASAEIVHGLAADVAERPQNESSSDGDSAPSDAQPRDSNVHASTTTPVQQSRSVDNVASLVNTVTLPASPRHIRLYFFVRCAREKENWFHRSVCPSLNTRLIIVCRFRQAANGYLTGDGARSEPARLTRTVSQDGADSPMGQHVPSEEALLYAHAQSLFVK